MGGHGDGTCMSEDAQELVKSFQRDYDLLEQRRELVNETTLELMVRASQMSASGLLVPETNPDVIIDNLNLVDPASLR